MVDRLVADVPARSVWVGHTKMGRDLHRTPLTHLKLVLQTWCSARSRLSRPLRTRRTSYRPRRVRQVAVVALMLVRARLRRSSRLIVDGDRLSLRAISRTPRPRSRSVEIRWRPVSDRYRPGRAGSATLRRRDAAGLGSPPAARLAGDAHRAATVPIPAEINLQYPASMSN